MKKWLVFGLFLLSGLLFTACKPSSSSYVFNYYDYMDTFIQIQIESVAEKQGHKKVYSADEMKQHEDAIGAIFSMYHELSTNFEPLKDPNTYLENIFSINQKRNQKLEIDRELFDLIAFAEELKVLTDGYFDVSIGKTVDIWKSIMTVETESIKVDDYVFIFSYRNTSGDVIEKNVFGVVESISTNSSNQKIYTMRLDDETIDVMANDHIQKMNFQRGDRYYVYYVYDGEKKLENKVLINQAGIVSAVHLNVDARNQPIVEQVELDLGDRTITIDKNDVYQKEITQASYDWALSQSQALDFSQNELVLEEENQKYYITLKGEDAKIDLGAISKGYATQLVYEYLNDLGFIYYSISSGTSSIVLGQNTQRPNEGYIYAVGLANPYRIVVTDPNTYGRVFVKDTGITTSGNYEQFVLFNGERLHHILSPFTKKPTQYYHTVSLIGRDAGLLDALSTALFSMPPEVMENWLELYQEEYGLEVIRFNQDLTIDSFLTTTVFEEN